MNTSLNLPRAIYKFEQRYAPRNPLKGGMFHDTLLKLVRAVWQDAMEEAAGEGYFLADFQKAKGNREAAHFARTVGENILRRSLRTWATNDGHDAAFGYGGVRTAVQAALNELRRAARPTRKPRARRRGR